MKFMLMMQGSVKGFESLATWSPSDFKAHVEFMHALNRDLTERGELVAAEGLDMPGKAKIVTAGKGGPAAITDGPFPESKEFLAGFWIVDVESPQRAEAIAAQVSGAPGKDGAPVYIPVEVRQVMGAPNVDAM